MNFFLTFGCFGLHSAHFAERLSWILVLFPPLRSTAFGRTKTTTLTCSFRSVCFTPFKTQLLSCSIPWFLIDSSLIPWFLLIKVNQLLIVIASLGLPSSLLSEGIVISSHLLNQHQISNNQHNPVQTSMLQILPFFCFSRESSTLAALGAPAVNFQWQVNEGSYWGECCPCKDTRLIRLQSSLYLSHIHYSIGKFFSSHIPAGRKAGVRVQGQHSLSRDS